MSFCTQLRVYLNSLGELPDSLVILAESIDLAMDDAVRAISTIDMMAEGVDFSHRHSTRAKRGRKPTVES
jgi:hypothetical protein